MSSANALTDAAMFHAAYRLLHNKQPQQEFSLASQFDDEGLFLQLLHSIIFFDKLCVSNACSPSLYAVHSEVEEIATYINDLLGLELIQAIQVKINLNEHYQLRRIATHLLRHISTLPNALRLAQWNVPWAYRDKRHYHNDALYDICNKHNISENFVPFAAYCLSGIVYSGIACGRGLSGKEDMIYVAAPGRISALEQILSCEEIMSFNLFKAAYKTLSLETGLPPNGFSFQHISTSLPPHETSRLAELFSCKAPDCALKLACNFRQESEYKDLRDKWPLNITVLESGSSIGFPANQTIKDTVVHGNLTMIIGTPKQ